MDYICSYVISISAKDIQEISWDRICGGTINDALEKLGLSALSMLLRHAAGGHNPSFPGKRSPVLIMIPSFQSCSCLLHNSQVLQQMK